MGKRRVVTVRLDEETYQHLRTDAFIRAESLGGTLAEIFIEYLEGFDPSSPEIPSDPDTPSPPPRSNRSKNRKENR